MIYTWDGTPDGSWVEIIIWVDNLQYACVDCLISPLLQLLSLFNCCHDDGQGKYLLHYNVGTRETDKNDNKKLTKQIK